MSKSLLLISMAVMALTRLRSVAINRFLFLIFTVSILISISTVGIIYHTIKSS